MICGRFVTLCASVLRMSQAEVDKGSYTNGVSVELDGNFELAAHADTGSCVSSRRPPSPAFSAPRVVRTPTQDRACRRASRLLRLSPRVAVGFVVLFAHHSIALHSIATGSSCSCRSCCCCSPRRSASPSVRRDRTWRHTTRQGTAARQLSNLERNHNHDAARAHFRSPSRCMTTSSPLHNT